MADSIRVFTEQEIKSMLDDGYISVHKDLWDRIPNGSHVRYLKKETANKEPRGQRFKPGGFVKNHHEKDGAKMLILQSSFKASPSSKSWVVTYEGLEEIWKKYDYHSFIEIYLISNSLAKKKKEIEELTKRVEALEFSLSK